MFKFFRLHYFIICIFAVISHCSLAHELPNVCIVYSAKHAGFYNLLNEMFWEQHKGKFNIFGVKINEHAENSLLKEVLEDSNIIISMGSRALLEVLRLGLNAPILATIVKKYSFEELAKFYGSNNVTALFAEHSLERYLYLIESISLISNKPQVLGMLIKNSQSNLFEELNTAAKRRGIKTYIKQISEDSDIFNELGEVLEKSNVLLVLADAKIIDSNNAQAVIITSMRKGVPVVAYSKALVKIGALAAVYSTNHAYTKEIMASAINIINTGKLPVPSFPKEYAVAINEPIADALSLNVNNTKKIKSLMDIIEDSG